jgi:predicted RNase H-like nuclease (RuvC/YqgF family)
MAASSVTYFLKSLHAKANKEIEKGIEICFNASVVNNNKSQKMLDMEPVDTMTKQINNMVKTEKPEIIKVDLLTEDGKWIEGNVCDLRAKSTVSKTQNFQGFGEAEINALVERRFEEKKKDDDFIEMKDIVKDLATENEELKARVAELEKENEEMEQSLERKKQIKHYAGMVEIPRKLGR